nr:immunoglobulin heavy chain junction region [Mus musculus]MBK4196107.1 immunoglobulin heavy chain junction region [Mus musculus]
CARGYDGYYFDYW